MYIRSSTEQVGAVAAIDIGSNSIHMVVARLDRNGHFVVLDSDKVSIRLGAFLQTDGTMSREGQLKAIRTMAHMKEIASAYKATIRAVATHAMREASNHAELIDEIHSRTGIRIDIIDGVEEARLVYLGMRYALPLENQICLGMDIGGGSTEFILARGDTAQFVTSVKIGAVTLTARHFGNSSPTDSKIKKLHDYINLRIEPLNVQVLKHRFKKAVASSGTAKAIAGLHSRLFRGRPLNDENGYVIPKEDLEAIVRALEELKSPKRIREALGIDAARADILLAGAAIMREASRAFKVKEWIISDYGLREGVVIDSFRRMGGDRLGKVKDIRWGRVRELGELWQIDEGYAKQVTATAMEIFDKLAPVLYPRGGKAEWMGDRDILSVASWLHEAGKFLSTSSYHRHSHYLIFHCRLDGFTQDERHMISLVALHHRKSSPKYEEHERAGLRGEEFERIVFLSAILRMASALNRTRRGIITGIRVGKTRTLHFGFRVAKGKDPIVELQQLEREREHLEKAFGWHFVVDIDKRAMRGSEPRQKKKAKKIARSVKKTRPKVRKKLRKFVEKKSGTKKKKPVKKKGGTKKATKKKSTSRKKSTKKAKKKK